MAARALFGRSPSLALLGLVLASLVLQGAVPLHTHDSPVPAFYNQEHDLTTLAAFGTGVPLPASVPLVAPVVVLGLLVIPLGSRPLGAPLRHADFRAPPTR
jgi:hypothetical protein